MTEIPNVVFEAEAMFCSGDVDGFLALLPDKSQVCIPGDTRISGDHDKAEAGPAMEELAAAIRNGTFRPEVICRYGDAEGAVSVLDNHVKVDGSERKYHSIHEWIVQDGQLRALLVYVHEYDLFDAVWR